LLRRVNRRSRREEKHEKEQRYGKTLWALARSYK
jgi:hypothetical protein